MADTSGNAVPGPTLSNALRALPMATPLRSAWPAVAAGLPARRVAAWRRLPVRVAAVAATLAVLVALPFLRGDVAETSESVARIDAAPVHGSHVDNRGAEAIDAGHVVAPASDPMDALLRESAQLEAWIAWSGGPASASGASASLELDARDRIGAIDALLARPELDPEAQWPLLQERLVRLRELAGLQNTRQLLAVNGDDAMAVPVAVF